VTATFKPLSHDVWLFVDVLGSSSRVPAQSVGTLRGRVPNRH
jgi:hypothetical protein